MSLAAETQPLDPTGTDHFLDVDGLQWHYNLINGPDTEPPLIFTHGGGPGATGWNNFLYNARALSAGRRCYFLDLPQYGQSSMAPISGPVFSWYADAIAAFMRSAGIERASFVNQSHGGCALIALAAKRPDLIEKMIIIASQPIFGGVVAPIALMTKRAQTVVSDYYHGGGGPSRSKMRRLLADLEFYDEGRLTELNLDARYTASLRPEMAQLAATPGANGDWESLLPLFEKVSAPTLILWGAYDWFGGPDVALLMVNQFADARLHVLGRAAHHLQTERPVEFNEQALAFFNHRS